MGHLVIVCYRPRAGCEADLLQLVREHHLILARENLVTPRKPVVLRAANGTLIELFEWRSAEAVEAAHKNPTVLGMWERFGAAGEFVPLKELAEAGELFPHFASVDL
jgi:hypothetical protein